MHGIDTKLKATINNFNRKIHGNALLAYHLGHVSWLVDGTLIGALSISAWEGAH
jgi:hypothetical protein